MTSNILDEIETEVLVIGAGPVGLALAGDLGWRGRKSIVIDQGDGSIFQPKMDMVGVRTMEFCRRWGIVADVEASPYKRDYPQDNVYLTALNGYELGRQPMPSMRDDRPGPESPQKRERCPQNMFDPILRKFAESTPNAKLMFQHKFLSFTQDENGVTAQVVDMNTQREFTLRARYLVGCDGGRSKVREQLGIAMNGKGVLTYTTNFIFRCPEFNRLHDKQPGYRYMFVGPTGTWATIVAINGNDNWRMSIIGNAKEKRDYTEDELKGFAQKALGRPFEMEILSVLRWQRAELVADRYREGRVFICGDACHLTSPTGGLGMNTGIGDAVDLSWKLAAALEGWGGPALFESYEVERRPIATRITRFSTGNLETMKLVPTNEQIYDDTPEGASIRERAGHALGEGLKREWFSTNMHLGNRYVGSPVNVYNEPENDAQNAAEFEDAINYVPSTRPGCRAPHVWLDDGRSTLDLFGRGFVLLAFDEPGADVSGDLQALLDAARRKAIPIEIIRIGQAQVREAYSRRFVLVRPDGHVAWRADAIPSDASQILDKISGNLRTINETISV